MFHAALVLLSIPGNSLHNGTNTPYTRDLSQDNSQPTEEGLALSCHLNFRLIMLRLILPLEQPNNSPVATSGIEWEAFMSQIFKT